MYLFDLCLSGFRVDIHQVLGKVSLQTTKDEKNHGFISETWNSESGISIFLASNAVRACSATVILTIPTNPNCFIHREIHQYLWHFISQFLYQLYWSCSISEHLRCQQQKHKKQGDELLQLSWRAKSTSMPFEFLDILWWTRELLSSPGHH